MAEETDPYLRYLQEEAAKNNAPEQPEEQGDHSDPVRNAFQRTVVKNNRLLAKVFRAHIPKPKDDKDAG